MPDPRCHAAEHAYPSACISGPRHRARIRRQRSACRVLVGLGGPRVSASSMSFFVPAAMATEACTSTVTNWCRSDGKPDRPRRACWIFRRTASSRSRAAASRRLGSASGGQWSAGHRARVSAADTRLLVTGLRSTAATRGQPTVGWRDSFGVPPVQRRAAAALDSPVRHVGAGDDGRRVHRRRRLRRVRDVRNRVGPPSDPRPDGRKQLPGKSENLHRRM